MVVEMHHLVGSAEVGRMLGVSRQRVQQLISRADFPKPEVVLEMGKVWKRADVIGWAKDHGRNLVDDSPEAPAEDPCRAAIRKLPPMR
jgi:predicted DNA-binding transcriptional regulator AlpA